MTHAPKLARYEVLGRLATGGMAEVWLARSKGVAGFEKLVVIKTILPGLAESPQFVAMFVNEARLAAMLSHPNCVQIFDLGQEGDCLYIAMEYLEGFSLARVLQRARLKGVVMSEGIIARIIMDAASGLDYSHRLKDREGRPVGLVHRDVSPDNLLVGFSGQVKVVDFGIAKAATPALLATVTSAGMVKGKHGYIAPEYLLGLPLDGRADVFALGVVLYRALTGKRPFLGDSEAAISMAVISDRPREPLDLVPTLNPALATVVMMALEKEPNDRFESARAMRQAIEVAVVHAAENEEVADLLNELWPPGDEERVALHELASGTSEQTSSPVLSSVVSGTYPGMATPNHPQPPAKLVPTGYLAQPVPRETVVVPAESFDGPAEPPTLIARPPTEAADASSTSSSALPPVGAPSQRTPSFDSAEQPVFEQPPTSRAWLVGLAVVALVSVAGLGMFFKDRPRNVSASEVQVTAPPPPVSTGTGMGQLSVSTPVMVKVFEGKQELGSSPLAMDIPIGLHTLRLSNRALGIDQTVEITIEEGQVGSITELAKGVLVVKADPWAYVKLDGKQLGQTPIPPRSVYEGVHVVELNNTNLNVTKRLEVRVKGGETRTVNVKLDE